MPECTNCIHYFVCKTLKGKLKNSYAEACVAYLNRKDCVAVVRCKDCKHATAHPFEVNSQNLVCTKPINWRAVEKEHFCSYGERKDNGEEEKDG